MGGPGDFGKATEYQVMLALDHCECWTLVITSLIERYLFEAMLTAPVYKL